MDPDTVEVATVIPVEYCSLFKYAYFNRMQSLLVDSVLNSNDNIVVASPTGSGKTVILELAILRLLLRKSGDIKCLFIAPNKALCQQRASEWIEKFGTLGLM